MTREAGSCYQQPAFQVLFIEQITERDRETETERERQGEVMSNRSIPILNHASRPPSSKLSEITSNVYVKINLLLLISSSKLEHELWVK